MDEFDRLLYEGSAQLPPELSELAPPRPWKKPIGQICWGLALITITLNFFGLNILLPAVGTSLLWLGLAPLRRENGASVSSSPWLSSVSTGASAFLARSGRRSAAAPCLSEMSAISA